MPVEGSANGQLINPLLGCPVRQIASRRYRYLSPDVTQGPSAHGVPKRSIRIIYSKRRRVRTGRAFNPAPTVDRLGHLPPNAGVRCSVLLPPAHGRWPLPTKDRHIAIHAFPATRNRLIGFVPYADVAIAG